MILIDNFLVKFGKELEDLGLFGIYYMFLDIKEELMIGKFMLVEGCFCLYIKVVMESMKYFIGFVRFLI